MASKDENDQDIQNDNMQESQNILENIDTKEATGGITIEVSNPRVKDDTFNKYIAYTVKGVDNNGPFEVVRRYSDFDKVRTLLIAKWPGCYIPPIPPKSLNSMEAKFVKERKRYLHVFCQKIASIPMLHYYSGYQEFLRSKSTSLDKVFQPMMKPDYEEIITRYSTTFEHMKEKEYSLNLVRSIGDFKTFLKKVQAQNENVKKFAKAIVKAKNDFYQEFAFLNGLVAMEYEKNVFSEYHTLGDSGNVFYGENSNELLGLADKIEAASKTASYEYLEEWYKAESREFDALLDAIEQQEVYANLKLKAQEKQKSDAEDLQKVLAGKQSVKAMLFRKNKDEEMKEVEKQVEKSNRELEQLTILNDMITLILGYDEIEKFKRIKSKPYYNCIKANAQKELETLTTMETYWNKILENKNLQSS